MKISLNAGQNESTSSRAAQARILERDIVAAKKGDWNAKNNLARSFLPLLTSLAEKRTTDPGRINLYIEAGKEGLFRAARRYKQSVGADSFQIFALDFIEAAMDRGVGGKKGLFSRLFGSK